MSLSLSILSVKHTVQEVWNHACCIPYVQQAKQPSSHHLPQQWLFSPTAFPRWVRVTERVKVLLAKGYQKEQVTCSLLSPVRPLSTVSA